MRTSSETWEEGTIMDLLLTDPVDLTLLRRISRQPGGFLTNSVRARAWAKILQVNRYETESPYDITRNKVHKETEQIHCDIERSLWHFDRIANWKAAKRNRRRAQLSAIIHAVLLNHPEMHYYQGYHDVISVFLLVSDDVEIAFAMSEYVSVHYLADIMRPDFLLVTKELGLVFSLLKELDPEVYDHIHAAQMEPFFCLSWIITWFSHDLRQLEVAARLFDVFICSHPVFSLYLSVQIVLFRRTEILEAECEFSALHSLLTKLPDDLPWEDLIQSTDAMLTMFPPRSLDRLVHPDLVAEIEQRSIALLSNPGHLLAKSMPPDWLLLQGHRHQLGKPRSSRLMRQKRAFAVQAETRLGMSIERTKYMRKNENMQLDRDAFKDRKHAARGGGIPLLKPAVILSVAAAVVAYITVSGQNSGLFDLFHSAG